MKDVAMMDPAEQILTLMDEGESLHAPTLKTHAEHSWKVATTMMTLWPEGMTVRLMRAALLNCAPPDLAPRELALLRFADSYTRVFDWLGDNAAQRSAATIENVQRDAEAQMVNLAPEAYIRARILLSLNTTWSFAQ